MDVVVTTFGFIKKDYKFCFCKAAKTAVKYRCKVGILYKMYI